LPTPAIWGNGYLSDKANSPLKTWRKWATDVTGIAIDCGHFIVEEKLRLATGALVDVFA